MATTYPHSTYPLLARSGFEDDLLVQRTVLDDGSPHIALLGPKAWRFGQFTTVPFLKEKAQTLAEYLETNRAEEFDVTFGSVVYRGYVWSSVRLESIQGNLFQVSFDFRGYLYA